MGPRDVLKEYFGYDTFRTVQEDVISAILSGKDVMAIMPTGAGKSICFQIPAMLLPKGTVIISPLISLMKDQVEALTEQDPGLLCEQHGPLRGVDRAAA